MSVRYPAAAVLMALTSVALSVRGAAMVATQSAMKAFLGGEAGVLAFVDKQDNTKVKWVDISDASLTVRTLSSQTGCSDPILAADGTRALWVQGGKVWAQRLSGGSAVQVGTGVSGFWHTEGSTEFIVFCDATAKFESQNGDTYRQRIRNGIEPDGSRETIYNARAMDGGITSDGRWLGETYGGHYAYDLVNRKEYGTFYKSDGTTEGQACNGSMLRDGTHRFLMLVLPHDYIRLFGYNSSTDRWTEVRTFTKPSGTVEWQQPEIATNASYFTATAKQSDGTYHLYLVNTSTRAALRVVSGDIGNSHLYVGATQAASPVIALTPSSLSFSAQAGGTDPAAQTVTVTNAGGAGTLTSVTVTESAAWLTVTCAGSGNTQTLSNAVSVAGLAEGTYNTTVSVSGGGASNTATYTVTLRVTGQPQASSVTIIPASASVAPGGTVLLTATVHDQSGQPFAAVITWQVSGLGTLSPATSSSAVTSHTTTFTSSGALGAATVVASAAGVSDTATLTVADIHVRVNAGSNTYDVAGWERDDAYVSGGEDWVNPNTVSTAGVTGAAPADLYKSVRHRTPHAYSLPSSKVPDGTYLLRMHFADAYSDRDMKYTVEGQVILDHFDIVGEAGVNTALVREFTVVVADGNGLQIACEAYDGGDVFEAGFEAIRVAGLPAAPAQVLAPNGDETYAVGDTMTIRWQTNNAAVFNDCMVAVSPDGGERWHIVTAASSIEQSSPAWGTLRWPIPASVLLDDGQTVAMAGSACKVKVYQYNDPSVCDASDAAFTVSAGAAVGIRSRQQVRAVSWRVVNGMLTVAGTGRVRLVNAAGAVALDRTVASGRPVEIGLAGFTGAYVLRIETGGRQSADRLVLAR